MNTTLKALIAITALSTVSTCFTVSKATAGVPEQPEYDIVLINKYTSTSQFDKDIGAPTNIVATESFAQIFDKPLVRIPLDDVMTSTKAFKKSELFELATVLNDKIQQLIALFTQDSPSYSVNEHGEMALKKTKTCKIDRS
ncbi:hypothetical protein ACFSJY_00095 [Thalassotalea euphylliae]|uniref:hypothetical protein n=1 Tax=Thalassotalea euphylliae TaxID=1655234 RepID=UPI00363237CC